MIVDLDTTDVVKGDPETHVMGKPEEKSARVHRKPDPKPFSMKRLELDFEQRRATLRAELDVIEATIRALKGTKR